MDYDKFELGDVTLLSGEVLSSAFLAYKTYGTLDANKSNVVVLPTFYTGSHQRNEGFFGPGRAIDPDKHFVVSIDMFGNGFSSSPSNTESPQDGPRFPHVSLWDNVACQYRLITEALGVKRIALVTGWSMAGCQSYQWAAQYPDFVDAILPFCASAKTSPHNYVFLEGLGLHFVQIKIGIMVNTPLLLLMDSKHLRGSMRDGHSHKLFIETHSIKQLATNQLRIYWLTGRRTMLKIGMLTIFSVS